LTDSASASRGNVDGEGTTQVNSHVSAGDRLTISSGGDTNLKGAVASANQVVADVKGNLNIESLQDASTLDGKRQSASVSGTVGAGAGFSASISQSKVHNDFASVQEQSGIRAGDGGFQVQVAGNTDLKGGVISSSEQAIKDGRNSLATGTLTFNDIQNRDSTEASGVSMGVNVGKNQNGSTFSPSVAPGIGQLSASQGSVTRSGVSGGALTVGDQQAGPALANLNRDVTTGKDTAGALTKGWNGAQALDEVGAQMQITSAAMPRLAKEIGDYAARKVEELKGNPEEAAKWAEGGIYRVAVHAALGALGGGLEGALGAGSSAAAAPTFGKLQNALQDRLVNAGLSDAADLTAKLIADGTAAAVGGAVGGGAGAITGLNADANNRQLLHSEAEKLAVLKRGKSADAQHKLDAAACALVRCAEGVPNSDALYTKLQALQNEGQGYNAEQMALKATGGFVYRPYTDAARDALTSHAELLRRTSGAINLGAGSLGTVGGRCQEFCVLRSV
jgi:filamentous hemagglutinin